jgi:hypothetical protein
VIDRVKRLEHRVDRQTHGRPNGFLPDDMSAGHGPFSRDRHGLSDVPALGPRDSLADWSAARGEGQRGDFSLGRVVQAMVGGAERRNALRAAAPNNSRDPVIDAATRGESVRACRATSSTAASSPACARTMILGSSTASLACLGRRAPATT